MQAKFAGQVALAAAALAAAFWLGGRWRSQPAAPASEAAPPAPRAPSPAAQPAGVDAEALRRIVREELALQATSAASQAAPVTGATDAEAAPATTPSAEQQAQAQAAAQILDGAVRAGRWTREDRTRFAAAAGPLPPPLQFELQRSLHVAINRGQVTIEDGLPPFAPAPPPAAAR